MNIRTAAEEFRIHAELPVHGFVIFYKGEPCAWVESLEPEHVRKFKRGCIAVPPYRNAPCFVAEGQHESDPAGAARWQKIAKIEEPT